MANNKYSKMKNDYHLLIKSGMFWEFHPELTGDWTKDKMVWKKIWRKHQANLK